MQYISYIRSWTIKALLMICVTCNAHSILADSANFWAFNDKAEDYTPSLKLCTNVISNGIRFNYKSNLTASDVDAGYKNVSFYIFDGMQFLISVYQGGFSCKYLGRFRESEYTDTANLSFGDKLVAAKDMCDPSGEIHRECMNFTGKSPLTGKDMDICFKDFHKANRIKIYIEKCVNNFFRN